MDFELQQCQQLGEEFEFEDWLREAFDPIQTPINQTERANYIDLVLDESQETKLEKSKVREVSKRLVRRRGNARPLKQCIRWTQLEDIFLAGIVLDIYCVRHSLKPRSSERKGEQQFVWREIHEKYELACMRYNKSKGTNLSSRTLKALQKRWQETGTHSNDEAASEQKQRTKAYLSLWTETLNRNGILTSPLKAVKQPKPSIEY